MITSLIRQYLINFKPYVSARSCYQSGLLLDANENSFGSTASGVPDGLNRYPDPNAGQLKRALANWTGVGPDNIFVGNGSDEIIDLLIRLLVEPAEEIIVCEPTYGMYSVAASALNVRVLTCPLTTDWQIDPPAIKQMVSNKTKLVFCCSPNNPTGNLLAIDDIETLCRDFRAVVVVDEAYIEFSSRPSLASLVKQYENLVILRTLSKAWGLAGLRVGYIIANPVLVQYLNKIKLPYNVNSLSMKIACQALSNPERFNRFRNQIIAERTKLASALTAMGLTVFPSEANFLLVRCPAAAKIVARLAEEYKIIVRDMSDKPRLNDCLRITIGTPEQNQKLLQALKKVL